MKKPITPKSQIVSTLRLLWLKSRERAECLRRDNYTCQECGKKQSKRKGQIVKVEVHHLTPINWEYMVEYIRRHLLVDSKNLETLCKDCHKKITGWIK